MTTTRQRTRKLANLLSSFIKGGGEQGAADDPETRVCLSCGAFLTGSKSYEKLKTCSYCGFHFNISARERINLLADEGTFKELNRSLISMDPLSFSGGVSYRKKLHDAQKMTGLTEAAVTGTCEIKGCPTVIAVLDFGFLGGSMGCVVGEKVTLAFETAVKKKLPIVAVVTSGGARIQEGVLSLMQMAKTVAAAKRLRKPGLPFITVLTNPTTGQVYSSFANMADIILAEPDALVGFAPLRAVKESSGSPLPTGAHTSESHLAHGMIDKVVDREQLPDILSLLLDMLYSRYKVEVRGKKPKMGYSTTYNASAWEQVRLARHEQRPTALDYIGRMASSFVELKGDRVHGDDEAVVAGLGYLGGQAVVVLGQEKGHGPDSRKRNNGRTGPEGFRKAMRMMRMASRFHLPLITFIDTPGPLLSLAAEERGLGNAIANTMALLSDLPTPVISVIIGEGGSEGALAFGVADTILMLENAIYSPISPEGAATLLYGDAAKAETVALALQLTARDCKRLKIIDVVVPEPEGGAHQYPNEAAQQLQRILVRELLRVQAVPTNKLVKARYKKYRNMGEYSSHYREALMKEIEYLQGRVSSRVRSLGNRLPGAGKSSGSEDSNFRVSY